MYSCWKAQWDWDNICSSTRYSYSSLAESHRFWNPAQYSPMNIGRKEINDGQVVDRLRNTHPKEIQTVPRRKWCLMWSLSRKEQWNLRVQTVKAASAWRQWCWLSALPKVTSTNICRNMVETIGCHGWGGAGYRIRTCTGQDTALAQAQRVLGVRTRLLSGTRLFWGGRWTHFPGNSDSFWVCVGVLGMCIFRILPRSFKVQPQREM